MQRASSVRAGEPHDRLDMARRTAASKKLNLIKRAGSDPSLGAAAHQILGLMVNWADPDQRIRKKSVNYIAGAISRNRATVIRALAQLCGGGYLERIGRHNGTGNTSNEYRLCFDVGTALRANARETSRAESDKKRAPKHINSRKNAPMMVAPAPPSESHCRDTCIPDSFPSLPSSPRNSAIPKHNFEDVCSDNNQRERTTDIHQSNIRPKGTVVMQSRNRSNGLGIWHLKGRQKAQQHRHFCEGTVNALVTELNVWEILTEEELETAYDSEAKCEGDGKRQILTFIQQHNSAGAQL